VGDELPKPLIAGSLSNRDASIQRFAEELKQVLKEVRQCPHPFFLQVNKYKGRIMGLAEILRSIGFMVDVVQQ